MQALRRLLRYSHDTSHTDLLILNSQGLSSILHFMLTRIQTGLEIKLILFAQLPT